MKIAGKCASAEHDVTIVGSWFVCIAGTTSTSVNQVTRKKIVETDHQQKVTSK